MQKGRWTKKKLGGYKIAMFIFGAITATYTIIGIYDRVIQLLPETPRIAIIYYYANGGQNPPSEFETVKDIYGAIEFNHPSEEPEKEGYYFIGWLLNNDINDHRIDRAGQLILFDTERPDRNSTLRYYAQWTSNP